MNMIANSGHHTVFASQINAVIQVAGRLGVTQNQLLQSCHIEPGWLRHPEDRLPVQRFFDVYEAAARLSHCEDIGLYVGRVNYVDGTNLQLYMSTICNTFRDYLNLVPHMARLQGDIGEVIIRRAGEFIRLEWRPLHASTLSSRYLSDAVLISSMHIVNSICVDPILVRKACFSYPKPADCRMLEELFVAPHSFDEEVSCLYLDKGVLNSPMIKLAGERHDLPQGQLKDLFGDVDDADPFLLRVREHIMRSLPTEDLSIDKLASTLNMSRRTLQRRLTERDTHFMQVLVRPGIVFHCLQGLARHITHRLPQRHLFVGVDIVDLLVKCPQVVEISQ
jgi:hypothetical protein